MNQITEKGNFIKDKCGGACGIYIVHSIFPSDCPCQNFHECLGIYKLLKWNLWLEWRRENCEVRNHI